MRFRIVLAGWFVLTLMSASVVSTSGVATAAPVPKEKMRPGMQQFLGTWQLFFYEFNGKNIFSGTIVWNFDEGAFNTSDTLENLKARKGSYWKFKLDPKAEPATMDFIFHDKGENDPWNLCLYKFEDEDTLVICYRLPGEARPTAFDSKDNVHYTKYRRVKMK